MKITEPHNLQIEVLRSEISALKSEVLELKDLIVQMHQAIANKLSQEDIPEDEKDAQWIIDHEKGKKEIDSDGNEYMTLTDETVSRLIADGIITSFTYFLNHYIEKRRIKKYRIVKRYTFTYRGRDFWYLAPLEGDPPVFQGDAVGREEFDGDDYSKARWRRAELETLKESGKILY